ncbi:hypothetical protein BN14_10032 [Rhizoctonia solani AG-1 IB]|uniref:Uncharacterized protein n=1 Tax=Thanatephorus cucumeris (strain AG1-IB / isolate 7/3/14) TaxID=1108050 RepID=M5C913_THACB|nr:hypothetical protein BN14_10032 [Rhizoctonia solani AG-1 IB]
MEQIIKFIQRQEVIQIHRAYLEEHYGHFASVPKPEHVGDDMVEDLDVEEEGLPGTEANKETGINPEGEDEVGHGDNKGEEVDQGVEDINNAIVGMQLNPVSQHQGQIVAYFQPDLAIASIPTRLGVLGAKLIKIYAATNLIPLTTQFLERLRCRQSLTILNLFNIYHKLALSHPAPLFAPHKSIQQDVIRAYPATKSRSTR